MNDPLRIRDDAELECYRYFDRHIRPLPRRADGDFDKSNTIFADSDVDAFRHAYVSGVFTLEFGEHVASILGWINELLPIPSSGSSTEMDLWNNKVGRKLALKATNRTRLLESIKVALQSDQLIVHPSDKRDYGVIAPLNPTESQSLVIVLRKGRSGSNEWFFDRARLKTMSRAEFVAEIQAGRYPDYSIRRIGGEEYPVSERDRTKSNNLG